MIPKYATYKIEIQIQEKYREQQKIYIREYRNRYGFEIKS